MQDKVLKKIGIFSNNISTEDHVENRVFDESWFRPVVPTKSSRYAVPQGFWTLEVFHNGYTLIPEDRVTCLQEPHLDQRRQQMEILGSSKMFYHFGRPCWEPVTVTYAVLGNDVGTMLINDWEELMMVHHATGEMTYWLGVDKPDRTWTLKNWTVQNFSATPTGSAILEAHITFLYSEATLTGH